MTRKSALLLFQDHASERRLLFVKERGERYWIFPGGKQRPRESMKAALVREVREELGAEVATSKLLGTVRGATPDGLPLTLSLYVGSVKGTLTPQSEIATMKWVSKADLSTIEPNLTPITVGRVLPLLERSRVW